MNRLILALCLGLAMSATAILSAQPMKDPNVIPAGAIHAHSPAEIEHGTKICVTECKTTTKTVYSSACREYCQSNVSIIGWLRKCCGLDSSECGDCGTVHTKSVLIKKTISGEPKTICVLKDPSTLPVVPPTPAKK